MILKQRIRRVAVGGGILALALAGMLGSTSALAAEGYPVVPDQNGTLTLHKHVKKDGSPEGNPTGAPLAGVGFSVQKIGKQNGAVCDPIALTTPQGWEAVAAALATFDANTGAIPTGFCADGASIPLLTDANGIDDVNPAKGLYLVVETSPGANLITEQAAPFLVTVPMPVPASNTWDFSVDVYPKNVLGTFSPTKTVAANNTGSTPLVPGAIVPWTVTSSIPKASFPYTTVSIADSPAAGHVFEAWGEVRLNGALLAAPGSPTPDYSVSGGTLTFTAPGLAKVNAATTGASGSTATLEAKLTTKVTTEDLGSFENKASVTLNSTTVPVTPPVTNWGKLVITKHVAGNENSTLAGARFAIYEKTVAGCATDVTGTPVWTTPALPETSAAVQSAVLWISNTAAGAAVGSKAYCLKETAAPTGYVLDPTPREVTIGSTTVAVQIKVPNVPVPNPPLPLTGSTGAMAFGIVGFGLIGVAGALYAVRRAKALKR